MKIELLIAVLAAIVGLVTGWTCYEFLYIERFAMASIQGLISILSFSLCFFLLNLIKH